MKKIFGVFSSVVLAFLLVSVSSEAQTPEGQSYAALAARQGLPIRNMAVLRSYAEKASVQGSLQLNHPGIIPNGYAVAHSGLNTNFDANAVLGTLRTDLFSFGLSDTNGPVSLNVNLQNETGLLMFSGHTQSLWVEKKPGIFWLNPSDVVHIRIVPFPPIHIPGLESARAVLYDSNGNLVFNSFLRVDGNNLMYPTNLVERRGEYVLNFREKDGGLKTDVFDAVSGEIKNIQRGEGYALMDIEGDYWFGVNPPSIELFNVEIRGAIVRFKVEALPNGNITGIKAGGTSSLQEVPLGFIFRLGRSSNPFVYLPNAVGSYTFFPPGEYELIYILTPEDLDGIPIVFPDDGKG